MRETIASVGAWALETFPGGDDMGSRHALRMLEEAAELCCAAGANWGDIHIALMKALEEHADQHRGRPVPAKVPEEMADVVICLCSMAARRGVNLWAEVERKMAINRARTWRLNEDGTGYHVKAAQAGVTRMGGDAEGGSGERSELARGREAMRPDPSSSSTVIEDQQ